MDNTNQQQEININKIINKMSIEELEECICIELSRKFITSIYNKDNSNAE